VVPFRPRPARAARPIRRRLPRRALPWWAATLALAAATGLVADGVLQRAGDAEARWGTTRSVLVATGPIGPGDPLAGRTEARRLPAAAVPAAALDPASAGGAVAVDAIGAGEVVTTDRAGGPRARTLAGRLPPGTRAVLVPLEVTGLPVQVGDEVDLLPVSSPAAPAARAAEVVEVRTDALVVAVRPSEAAAVAAALGQGALVPALVSAVGD
jgi:Flp pilus assembly protein CpaB